MRGVARIRFAGGGVMLPARSPYDRETTLLALRHSLHRSGRVQFELDGRHWRLTCGEVAQCAQCLRTARLYGVDDARADGPICVTCLAALLSITRAASTVWSSSLAEDEPFSDAAAGGATSTVRSRAPGAGREDAVSWPHST